ncbi:MAG: helix-turn-helix domain-containing protein [Pseudonocardiaceae bacterium]
MSYGHADKLLAEPGSTIPRDPTTGRPEPPRPDPAIWDDPPIRAILDDRDITALYRALTSRGVSQHRIAKLTGQNQSEVSEIIKGRTVLNVIVLERIADGLGIPRSYIRLPAKASDTYHEDASPSGDAEEVDDDMLRRDAIAKGSIALTGAAVLGKLLTSSAGPGDLALPSQVGLADVAEIKHTTEQFRVAARTLGGQARAVSATAVQYGRLTSVPASDAVIPKLFSQLAELNELAGWCCFDGGSDRHARWHYREAIDLAHQVGDNYRIASALRFAGIIDSLRDRPDDALKQFDLAQLLLSAKGSGDSDLMAWLHAVSAYSLAETGHPNASDRLKMAQEGWQLSHAFERADQSYQTALVHAVLGHAETAELFASTVNGAGRIRPVGVFASVLRATIHVQAGEPRGLPMAKTAIDAVAPLHSTRARERLHPLITALESRPGSDHRDLARAARTIASARTA